LLNIFILRIFIGYLIKTVPPNLLTLKKPIPMIMELTLKDNDFLRQFEIIVDNHLATIEYSLQERKIFLTKINIPDDITEDDFQNTFIKIVFENIEERNLNVVPTCTPIVSFMRKNKQYRSLLPVGIKI